MRLASFGKIIASTFTDVMSIKRYIEQTNADGTTDSILPTQWLYTNIPCRLSFTGMERPNDSADDQVPIVLSPKIFCSVSVDIKPGDYISVNKLREDAVILSTYLGQIGLPSIYVTHKEALFYIKESA